MSSPRHRRTIRPNGGPNDTLARAPLMRPVLSALRVALAAMTLPAAAAAQSQPSPPLAPSITAAGRRPVPGPVYEIPEFTRAVDRGTRTRNGHPGTRNWVQHARYAIDVRLDPASDRVSGQERAVYF